MYISKSTMYISKPAMYIGKPKNQQCKSTMYISKPSIYIYQQTINIYQQTMTIYIVGIPTMQLTVKAWNVASSRKCVLYGTDVLLYVNRNDLVGTRLQRHNHSFSDNVSKSICIHSTFHSK